MSSNIPRQFNNSTIFDNGMDICHHNDVPKINDKYIDKQLQNKSLINDILLRLTLFYDNQRIYIHLNNHVINISSQSYLCSISHSTKPSCANE